MIDEEIWLALFRIVVCILLFQYYVAVYIPYPVLRGGVYTTFPVLCSDVYITFLVLRWCILLFQYYVAVYTTFLGLCGSVYTPYSVLWWCVYYFFGTMRQCVYSLSGTMWWCVYYFSSTMMHTFHVFDHLLGLVVRVINKLSHFWAFVLYNNNYFQSILWKKEMMQGSNLVAELADMADDNKQMSVDDEILSKTLHPLLAVDRVL